MTFRPDYSDQAGIFNPARFGHRLTLIGVGGIGGSALPILGTLGVPEIHIWDRDTVKPRNLASTILFGPDDVGKYKVDVAERELTRLGVPKVVTHRERFIAADHAELLEGVVISAVDTMAARQDIWTAVAGSPFVPLYLDGRIGGEIFQLNCVNPVDPDDVSWYEEFQLFGDENAAPLPCAARNVVYPSAVLGGIMASRLACFARGQKTGRQIIMDLKHLELIKL